MTVSTCLLSAVTTMSVQVITSAVT